MMDYVASHPGGSRNTPSRFMLQLRPDEPRGSYADLTSFSSRKVICHAPYDRYLKDVRAQKLPMYRFFQNLDCR